MNNARQHVQQPPQTCFCYALGKQVCPVHNPVVAKSSDQDTAPRAIAIGSVPNPTPLTSTRAQRREAKRLSERAEKRGRKLAIAAPVASGRELLEVAKYLMALETGQFQALMLAVFEARYDVAGRARVAKVMGCEAGEKIVLPDESTTLWTPRQHQDERKAANVRKGGRR